MEQRQRASRDLGLAGVSSWLQDYAQKEKRKVSVAEISLPCPSLSALSEREKRQLRRLTSSNQSHLHVYLKLVAKRWHERQSEKEGRLFNERTYYSPGLLAGLQFITDEYGQRIDLTQPRFLPQWSNFPKNYGRVFRFDLASSQIVIEVGGTQTANLLQPLLDRAVERSIWVPFPSTCDTYSFDAGNHSLERTVGYEIRLIPIRKPRKRGLVVLTNSGRPKVI